MIKGVTLCSPFCVPKYAREAASCHASREADSCHASREADSCHASREAASGRFGWWQVRLVAGFLYDEIETESIDEKRI